MRRGIATSKKRNRSRQDKIRAEIRGALPYAEDALVDWLVGKVNTEIKSTLQSQRGGRQIRKDAVEQVIHQEELAALGLIRFSK
jgi:hypothetical protein